MGAERGGRKGGEGRGGKSDALHSAEHRFPAPPVVNQCLEFDDAPLCRPKMPVTRVQCSAEGGGRAERDGGGGGGGRAYCKH